MENPQRRQQICGSSYRSTRTYSKGPTKEDEGKEMIVEMDFSLQELQAPVQWAGEQKEAALKSKVVEYTVV